MVSAANFFVDAILNENVYLAADDRDINGLFNDPIVNLDSL